MSDNTSGDGTTNVIDFARRTGHTGFNLTPTTTLPGHPVPPPPTTPPTNTAAPTPTAPAGRRSPLETLSALPDPGILAPVVTGPTPAPGQVPATFHSEPPADLVGPRLGALSLAACLAVAVAALRGSHTVLSTWWENRQARQAETAELREARFKQQLAGEEQTAKHHAAMQQIGDKAAQQRAKNNAKVPSSAEFGRKTLGGRGGSSGSSGKGPGSGKGSSGSSGGSGGSGRKNSPNGSGSHRSGLGSLLNPKNSNAKTRKNQPGDKGSGHGGHGGKSLKNGGSGGSSGSHPGPKTKTPKSPKAPHRASQGATNLKKTKHHGSNSPASGGGSGNGGSGGGKGGNSLPGALKKTAQKKAARRLKQRRKNLPTPAVWNGGKTKPGNKPNQPNSPTNPGQGAGGGGVNNTTKPGPGTKPSSTKNANSGRTTLAAAVRKAAYRAARKRLKKRRRSGVTPPIWTTTRRRKPSPSGPAGGGQASGGQITAGQQGQTAGGGAQQPSTGRGGKAGGRWSRVRAYARQKAAGGGCFGGTTPPGHPAGTPNGAPNGAPGAGTHTGAQAGGAPSGGTRRSPFGNAAHATTTTTYTVTSQRVPGSQAKTWNPSAITTGQPALPATGPAALDAAPTPHTQRPGTTRPRTPIPMPPAPRTIRTKETRTMTAHLTGGGHHMDAQHATEITLDDSLDALDGFTQDAFKTHDECSRLSKRARNLRLACERLAEELATKHNLIGRLFTAALHRVMESMDLVDRMAQEMEMSSLEAAEMAESANNELNDAYRPISKATADAGLTTPSAPIHNRA